MQRIAKLLATLFFIGYSPVAPGTVASLLAIGVYLLVKENVFIYFPLTIFLVVLGFWSSSVSEKSFSRKDPPQIVIDEFSSMLVVYFFIPFSLKYLVIGFLLFRLFDIFKIPAIKRLETLPKGFGIMLDDIAAAILANIVLQVLKFVIV